MLRNVGLRKSVEQPVLDLNFAASQIGSNGAPDSRIDFSRGGNAWFVDSDGLVKKSPHNLGLYSEDFTNWVVSNGVVTANQIAAPDGSLTADLLADDGTSGNHRFSRQIVASIGDTYFASIYVKATSDNTTILWREDKEDALSFGFNPTTGQITGGTGTAEDVGNGWYRLTITGALASQTVWSTEIRFSGTPASVYVWGAQLSQHSTLPVGNPYVKTETSQVFAARLDHDPSWFMSAAQEQNLFQYSEMLDDSYWTKALVNVTANAETDPLGGTTAEYIFATSPSGSFPRIEATFDAKNGAVHTVSFYAKAGEINVITASITKTDGTFVANLFSDEALTSEWQRFSATFTATEDTHTIKFFFGSGAKTWSGDQGFYIWGAQLEVGSTASTYHRTEGAPYYGPGATPKGLLIEEQRANLALQSEGFSVTANWFGSGDVTIAADEALAPDGTTTADKVSSADFSNGLNHVRQTITSVAAGDHTASVFVKAGTVDTFKFRLLTLAPSTVDNTSVFDLSSGSWTSVNGSHTVSTEEYGNGWYRLAVTFNNPALGNVQPRWGANTGNGFIYIWGAQLEQGSFPTSYIQTTASTATRNADVATMGPTTGGTELVTNGTYDIDTTGWTVEFGCTISQNSGNLRISAITDGVGAKTVNQTISSFVVGRRYRASFLFVGESVNVNARVRIRDDGSGGTYIAEQTTTTVGDTVTLDFTATNTTLIFQFRWDGYTGVVTGDYIDVDNASVRELYPFEQFNNTDGTFVVDAAGLDVPDSTLMQVDQGAVNTAPYLRCSILDGASARIFATISSSGANSYDGSGGVDTATENRVAFAYGTDPSDGVADKIQTATNGTVHTEGTTDASIGGFERVLLGSGAFFSDPAAAIKRIRYFNRRLLTQELKAITDD